jgi:hypothetical protein
LETSVPLVQAWPEGPDLALETFDSTIGPLHLTYFREVSGRAVAYYPHGIRIRMATRSRPYSTSRGKHTQVPPTTYRALRDRRAS